MKKILIGLVCLCGACLIPHQHIKPQTSKPKRISIVTDTLQKIDTVREMLVKNVSAYLKKRFPKSKLTPSHLVDVCLKHNFDICFAMAQAEVESGYGTQGKAKRTNSPWNVGACDGHSVKRIKKNGHAFEHPDHSIEPYILLIKRKYLGNKKSVHDLMNRFTTLGGSRYASNPSYERSIKNTYNRLKRVIWKPICE